MKCPVANMDSRQVIIVETFGVLIIAIYLSQHVCMLNLLLISMIHDLFSSTIALA